MARAEKKRCTLRATQVEHIFHVDFSRRGKKGFAYMVCPRPPCPLRRLSAGKRADAIRHLLEYHFLKVKHSSPDHTPFDQTCPRPPCPLP